MSCFCRSSRIISVRIILLDETDFIYELKDDLPGQALLDVVYARLNLIETAYFGIRYVDEDNQTHWMDPASRISRQLKCKTEPFNLYFGVKFYAADPCKLLEEITRYQLFLQVKQDVLQGRLPISFELAAELGAFVVQSELGDFDSRRHSVGYVSEFRLLANQTSELEERVSEIHQQLKGMSPATAEINYLDKVKWHDMYGVDLHPVLGEDSVEYYLGLTPSGIVVLRNKTTVAHYYWPRIAKVYYKGRYFMLRVCDKNNEVSTYGFETPRKSACKHLWLCCVEHHTFFRLVRVAPLHSPTGTSEFLSLRTRLGYRSSLAEKTKMKDVMSSSRTPPVFIRIPSKRQPRRVIDDTNNCKLLEKSTRNQEIKTFSIAQSALGYDNPYRSTYSIPTTLGVRPCNNQSTAPDSPRSTRSAPWPKGQQRSLFGNPSSPKSIRSVSTRNSINPTLHRHRSSSVESHSSNDSRSTRRLRHRHRRTSDNESELSRGSARSGRSARSHQSHRKHRRSRHRRDSGSENESSRGRSYSGHRISNFSAELVDSTHQWREVQRRQADGYIKNPVQHASVTKSSMATKNNYNNDTHSEGNSHHRGRRHKKNRSPSDSHNHIWSSELAKHLQFDLVDTTGMTEDQLREIPYTVVETHLSKRQGSSGLKVHKISNSNSSCNDNQGKDRVDRIRGLYFKDSNPNVSTGRKDGSIRSASTISSKDCDPNSGLLRMMSSMSMGDFASPTGSCLSPLDNSALRVSHEHTDSGLGAEQDYAYSSERSSDSTRYGTNKSSGASSGSHHISGHVVNPITHQAQRHCVSNKKPPLHPNRQQQIKSIGTAFIHSSCTNNTTNSSNYCTNQLTYTDDISTNNNRLTNNTSYSNNHYTFSLSRKGDISSPGDGYLLEKNHSLYSSSLFLGDGIKVTRGTKSDLGIPVKRITDETNSLANSFYSQRSKLPLVKSDQLLSYMNNSYNYSNKNQEPYHISGMKAKDTYEFNKTDRNLKLLYTSPKTVPNVAESFCTKSTFLDFENQYYQKKNYKATNQSTEVLGPLLYFEDKNDAVRNNNGGLRYQTANFMTTNTTNSPCSERLLGARMPNQQSFIQSTNRSSSLELILTPIIQSSRRAQ